MGNNKQPRVDFIELHILHHATEEWIFGVCMIEGLAEHGYSLNASQLYPRFHKLEKSGYLRRSERVVNGRLRKYYRATPAGRKYFRGEKKRLMELAGEALSEAEIQAVLRKRMERDRRKKGM